MEQKFISSYIQSNNAFVNTIFCTELHKLHFKVFVFLKVLEIIRDSACCEAFCPLSNSEHGEQMFLNTLIVLMFKCSIGVSKETVEESFSS